MQLAPVERLAGERYGSLRYPHVDRVRGRETELAALSRMLRQPQEQFAVICGAGGLGKTTVAAQLAACAEEEGWQVFWVRWRNSVDLAQQMTRVAVACGLPETDLEAARAGHENLPDVIWRQLASARRWLLARQHRRAPGCRPWGASGAVPGLDPPARPRPAAHHQPGHQRTDMGTMRAAFAAGTTGRARCGAGTAGCGTRAGTQAQAQELAERLGRLPLALYAAGSYLATPTSRYPTFERYRQALDAELGTLLGAEHPDASDPDVARTVVRHTWELSLDQLAAEGHVLARPLLRTLSLLAPAPVPLSLMIPDLLTAVTGQATTVVAVEAALAGLHRYGLLGTPGDPNVRVQPAQGDDLPAQAVLHSLVREISALALTAEIPTQLHGTRPWQLC